MGMYDKIPNFGEEFQAGDRFVILGAEYVGTIPTRYGDAEKSIFTIVSREHPTEKIRYSVLGVGFTRQAQNADRSDFPHVAEYVTVPTGDGKNEVKLLAKVEGVTPREFIDGDDGPPLPLDSVDMPMGSAHTEEDIPF